MFDRLIPPAKLRAMADTLGVDEKTAAEILGAVAMKRLLEEMGEGEMQITLAAPEDPWRSWDVRAIEADIAKVYPGWKVGARHKACDDGPDQHELAATHKKGHVTFATSPERLMTAVKSYEEKWAAEAARKAIRVRASAAPPIAPAAWSGVDDDEATKRAKDRERKREARAAAKKQTGAAGAANNAQSAPSRSREGIPGGATGPGVPSPENAAPTRSDGGHGHEVAQTQGRAGSLSPAPAQEPDIVALLEADGFERCPPADSHITPSQIRNAHGNWKRAADHGEDGALERSAAFLARAGWKAPATLPTGS